MGALYVGGTWSRTGTLNIWPSRFHRNRRGEKRVFRSLIQLRRRVYSPRPRPPHPTRYAHRIRRDCVTTTCSVATRSKVTSRLISFPSLIGFPRASVAAAAVARVAWLGYNSPRYSGKASAYTR